MPLQTYAHFADRDPLTKVVLVRMLAGVSTRCYQRIQEPVGEAVEAEARLTSKSPVSRQFVARKASSPWGVTTARPSLPAASARSSSSSGSATVAAATATPRARRGLNCQLGKGACQDSQRERYTLLPVLARLLRLAAAIAEAGPSAVLLTLRAKRRGAKQKLREFGPLVRVIRKRRPRVVVEIGTLHGGTLWAWCQLASPDALLLSIDLPGGAFGGGYSDAEAGRLVGHARPGQTLELIRGDSHDPATLARLQQALGSRKIDLLFIDADHSYDGVARDYEMYAPLVGRGGLIAFHDVLPGRPEDGEVSRFWREVRGRYSYREFTDPHDLSWRGQWGGIGVLFTE